jgi:hypothetical protein
MNATDYNSLNRTELRQHAKAAGIKYGKMSLLQIREALAGADTKLLSKPAKGPKKAISKANKGDNKKSRKQRTGTKMELALEICKKNPNMPRKGIIAKFISEAKLTKAGANTYYALCQKKIA